MKHSGCEWTLVSLGLLASLGRIYQVWGLNLVSFLLVKFAYLWVTRSCIRDLPTMLAISSKKWCILITVGSTCMLVGSLTSLLWVHWDWLSEWLFCLVFLLVFFLVFGSASLSLCAFWLFRFRLKQSPHF